MFQIQTPIVDGEFLKWVTTLGVGGVIAALMFMFYRKDIKMYTELWKVQSDQLIIIVKENTASNQKLITMLENQERNTVRKGDIELLINRRLGERNQPGWLDKDKS